MAIRKKIGKVSEPPKAKPKPDAKPEKVFKGEFTFTVPADTQMMYLHGYGPDYPQPPFRVELVRHNEKRWRRGIGNTPQEAIDNLANWGPDPDKKKTKASKKGAGYNQQSELQLEDKRPNAGNQEKEKAAGSKGASGNALRKRITLRKSR